MLGVAEGGRHASSDRREAPEESGNLKAASNLERLGIDDEEVTGLHRLAVGTDVNLGYVQVSLVNQPPPESRFFGARGGVTIRVDRVGHPAEIDEEVPPSRCGLPTGRIDGVRRVQRGEGAEVIPPGPHGLGPVAEVLGGLREQFEVLQARSGSSR